jgi:CRISPR-associated protein Csm4
MEMQLVRFRLKPKTAWMTPWHADTIGGLLAALYARAHTAEVAEAELIEPWRRGQPNLVLSDAFPENLLPAPANLSAFPGIREQDRKKIRTAAWLTREEFGSVQRGALPALFDRERTPPYKESVRLRNSVDRAVNSTGESGRLYEAAGQTLTNSKTLAIYARIADGRLAWAARLFALLAENGFGADAAVGAGEVEVDGPPEVISDLEPPEASGGWVSLSTFQPAKTDPTEGYWRSFVKYGKLGPDFALASVFKRPQWMLRAGACFRDTGERRDWYGRWIGAEDLLPDKLRKETEAVGLRLGQPAYAVALPFHWATAGAPLA